MTNIKIVSFDCTGAKWPAEFIAAPSPAASDQFKFVRLSAILLIACISKIALVPSLFKLEKLVMATSFVVMLELKEDDTTVDWDIPVAFALTL